MRHFDRFRESFFFKALATSLLILPTVSAAGHEPVDVERAQQLQRCSASPPSYLGTWDDALVPPDEDFILVRRERELLTRDMTGAADFRAILRSDDLIDSRMMALVAMADHSWVFFRSLTGSPFAIELQTGKRTEFPVNQRPPTADQGPNIVSISNRHRESKITLAVAPWGDFQQDWFSQFATGYRASDELEYFELDLISGESVRVPALAENHDVSVIEYYQQGKDTRLTGTFRSFGRQPDLAMRVESQVPAVRGVLNYVGETYAEPKPFRQEGILHSSTGELCRIDLYEHRNWTTDLFAPGVIIPWIWAMRPLWLHSSGRVVIGLWRKGRIQLEEVVVELP